MQRAIITGSCFDETLQFDSILISKVDCDNSWTIIIAGKSFKCQWMMRKFNTKLYTFRCEEREKKYWNYCKNLPFLIVAIFWEKNERKQNLSELKMKEEMKRGKIGHHIDEWTKKRETKEE